MPFCVSFRVLELDREAPVEDPHKYCMPRSIASQFLTGWPRCAHSATLRHPSNRSQLRLKLTDRSQNFRTPTLRSQSFHTFIRYTRTLPPAIKPAIKAHKRTVRLYVSDLLAHHEGFKPAYTYCITSHLHSMDKPSPYNICGQESNPPAAILWPGAGRRNALTPAMPQPPKIHELRSGPSWRNDDSNCAGREVRRDGRWALGRTAECCIKNDAKKMRQSVTKSLSWRAFRDKQASAGLYA